MGFKKRHHIANKKPEAKSMARLTAFNPLHSELRRSNIFYDLIAFFCLSYTN